MYRESVTMCTATNIFSPDFINGHTGCLVVQKARGTKSMQVKNKGKGENIWNIKNNQITTNLVSKHQSLGILMSGRTLREWAYN